MRTKVPARLPVQHPNAPHCPKCGVDLPNLNGMQVAFGFDCGELEVLSITLRIRCKCGAEWDLTKTAKK